jgi:hypothetical protein
LIEQQVVGSKEKLLGNNKTKQLRRIWLAQPSQHIHGRVVKKLEKGEIVASVNLHKKQVPKAINEASNMNKREGKSSINHVVCADNLSICSKHKKGRGKRRCFKCKEPSHFNASGPHKEKRMEQGYVLDAIMRTM